MKDLQPPLPEPSLYAVLDEDGLPMHLTTHTQMAQDHINDALDHDYDEAAKWVVRCVFTKDQLLEAYQAGQRDMREMAAGVCTGIALKPSNVILGVAVDCADAIRALPLEELK